MDFNAYQNKALETRTYPNMQYNLVYPAMGMMGEAGEVVEKIKKAWRKTGKMDSSILSEQDRHSVMLEMGDTLWYMACLATELGIPFDIIPKLNLAKLADRKERGVVKGEGDNR